MKPISVPVKDLLERARDESWTSALFIWHKSKKCNGQAKVHPAKLIIRKPVERTIEVTKLKERERETRLEEENR